MKILTKLLFLLASTLLMELRMDGTLARLEGKYLKVK